MALVCNKQTRLSTTILQTSLALLFAVCKHPPMTKTAWDRFVERHLAGLKELGLCEDALHREHALLQAGFLRDAWLALLAQRPSDGG